MAKTYTGVWSLCINVANFSGLYIHAANINNDALPVTLLSFTAIAVDNKYIKTDWATASETDNAGFEVETQHRWGELRRYRMGSSDMVIAL